MWHDSFKRTWRLAVKRLNTPFHWRGSTPRCEFPVLACRHPINLPPRQLLLCHALLWSFTGIP